MSECLCISFNDCSAICSLLVCPPRAGEFRGILLCLSLIIVYLSRLEVHLFERYLGMLMNRFERGCVSIFIFFISKITHPSYGGIKEILKTVKKLKPNLP